MRFLRHTLLLVVTAWCASAAWAFSHAYQAGRLVDASTENREKKGNTTTHAIFTVELAGVTYTVRGEKVGANAKDYTRGMIVGDPVEAAVDGEHLYLRGPKGEMKTDILKRARAGAN